MIDRPTPQESASPPHARAIRQRTLSALRWIAILGQTCALVGAELALGVDLPILACAACVGVSIWVNIAARLWSPRGRRLSERDALFALMFDLGQLAVLLYLTGGLSNPFSVFLLAPVTTAAMVLTLRTTLALGAFSIAAATLLAFEHMPLQLEDGNALMTPPLLLAGFWVAILLGVTFQAVYSRRVSLEAFEMSAALTATQMALEREQRLSSIGALAAAAAHELGTPLATIKLAAKELRGELSGDPALAELAEDADLISEQAARCRDILERLSVAQAPEDEQIKSAPITAVVEEAAAPHLYRRTAVEMRLNGMNIDAAKSANQPVVSRRPEIIHGLRNLVQNAVDFAGSTVWIDIETVGPEIVVRITDDGAGFRADILEKLGEPFATSRGRGAARSEDAYEGMGLGVFISKTLLERTGAKLEFANGADPLGRVLRGADRNRAVGAVVRVSWPRALLVEDDAGNSPSELIADAEDASEARRSAL